MKTPVYMTYKEITVTVEERRRYSNKRTFTWLRFTSPDGCIFLVPDPWPAVMPAKGQIKKQIDYYLGVSDL